MSQRDKVAHGDLSTRAMPHLHAAHVAALQGAVQPLLDADPLLDDWCSKAQNSTRVSPFLGTPAGAVPWLQCHLRRWSLRA